MIPILYEETEKDFRSEGIGRLNDSISCVITEARNGEYELELDYPSDSYMSKELNIGRIILAKSNDTDTDFQPFDIYKIDKSLTDVWTVYARHIRYRLSGIPVSPFTATGISTTLSMLKSNAMVDCPFTFWTDVDNADTVFTLTSPRDMQSCLGGTDGSILDVFSGSRGIEYKFDRFKVSLYAHRGNDNGVTLEYAKNILNLDAEEDASDFYTGVVGYWEDSQKVKETVYSDIQYVDNHERYTRQKIKVVNVTGDFEQEEEVTKDKVNKKSKSYVSKHKLDRNKENISINFEHLWQTEEYKKIAPLERVSLCDTVSIIDDGLGINLKSKVIKTKYDTLLERYDEIELGDTKKTFSDAVGDSVGSGQSENTTPQAGSGSAPGGVTESMLDEAIKHATDSLTGAYGGHVKIVTNAAGQPNEILVMDTDDEATATKVMRLNMNGLGGSSNGINGPYNSAILVDGQINGSAITAGEINGNLIRGGTIVAGSLDALLNQTITDAKNNADSALTEAGRANGTANNAQNNAQNAQNTANGAMNHADNAMDSADDARKKAMEAQKASDKANELANGALDGVQKISQVFYADSSGAHVASASGNETVVQSDGMHILVNRGEVARFTQNDSHVDNLAVARFLMAGAHRIESYTMNGEEGTGFFWIGDIK